MNISEFQAVKGLTMARGTRSEDLERTKDSNIKLRGENRKLKKQVALLRKELAKYQEAEIPSEEEWNTPVVSKEAKNSLPKDCPSCGEEITTFRAGLFQFRKCSKCSWRKRLKLT